MNFKDFWMDVLRSAAIVGIVMAISHIFEKYITLFSGLGLGVSSLIIFIEGIVAAVLFVGMLYYFTRRLAKGWNERVEYMGQVLDVKFSYSRALSYVLTVSMLASVIVGVASTIYVDIVGYDTFLAAQIAYIEETVDFVNAAGQMSGSENLVSVESMEDFVSQLEASERPSMFANIISLMSSYMLYGGLTGLVVAAVARRNIKQNVSSEYHE
jgi:archaellum component FlaG (FlaF/FlaG flagellin family)